MHRLDDLGRGHSQHRDLRSVGAGSLTAPEGSQRWRRAPRAHTSARPARSIGVYRLWRDAGFAVGALLSGIIADTWGVRAAIGTVAAITGVSGVVVVLRMYETVHHPHPDGVPA
jgi:predicted MFS family arabinose efflux permease